MDKPKMSREADGLRGPKFPGLACLFRASRARQVCRGFLGGGSLRPRPSPDKGLLNSRVAGRVVKEEITYTWCFERLAPGPVCAASACTDHGEALRSRRRHNILRRICRVSRRKQTDAVLLLSQLPEKRSTTNSQFLSGGRKRETKKNVGRGVEAEEAVVWYDPMVLLSTSGGVSGLRDGQGLAVVGSAAPLGRRLKRGEIKRKSGTGLQAFAR